MKKLIVFLMSAVLVVTFCFAFVSCAAGAKAYTVIFNVDGEEYKVLKVSEGTSVELPTEPAKEGYIFIGWYLDGEPFDEDTEITENLTLDAEWEKEGAEHIHRLTRYSSVSPTCTADGRIEYWYCILCKKSYTDAKAENEAESVTLDKTGHNLSHREAVAADCTTDGSVEHWYCSTCRKCYSDANAMNELSTAVVKAGHPALTHHGATAKGCATDGNIEYWSCSVCEKNYSDANGKNEVTDVVIKASHTLSHQAAIPASCTKDGYKEYWHCSVCKKRFSEETAQNEIENLVVPAKSHSYTGNKCKKCGDLIDSVGLAYEISVDGLSYTVVGIGTCTDTDIVIPAQHEEKPVTQIASQAFLNNTQIISVKVPDSVINIGLGAFAGCANIEKITLPFVGADKYGTTNTVFSHIFEESTYSSYVPQNLKTVVITGEVDIPDNAFRGCAGIKSVTLSNGVKSIGDYAFLYCDGLASLEIPDSVKSIGESSFAYTIGLKSIKIGSGVESIGRKAFYCSELESVTIGNGLTSVDTEAFANCHNLTAVYTTDINAWCGISFADEYANPLFIAQMLYLNGKLVTDLVVTDGAESIGSYSFYAYYALKSIKIPDTVKSVGYYAFYSCAQLTSITMGNGVESIEHNAFGYCIGLKSVNIGNNVKSIGNSAFRGCSVLDGVTLPKGLKSIGSSAFYGCSLDTVEIPDSVTNIGKSAFSNCSSLTSIKLPFIGAEKDGTKNTHFGYIFGASSYSDNYSSVPSNLKAVVITGGTVIPDYAFYECKNITSIQLPDNVESFGNYAFYRCKAFTEIDISDSVKRIGNYTFFGCSKIKSVTIGDYIESIGNYAFSICIELESVTMGNRVKTIGDYAFSGCESLLGIELPDSLKNIGNYAFASCKGFTSIEIPEGVESIGDYAFFGCANLYKEDNGAYYLSDYNGNPYFMFIEVKDKSITSYEINSNTKIIANNAFKDCTNLVSVEIPEGVRSIGASAFLGCISLKSIKFPDNLTSIATSAFEQCTSLQSIVIPDNVTVLGESSFEDCTSIISVTLGAKVTEIGSDAFSGCDRIVEVINKSELTISKGENMFGFVARDALEVHSGESKLVNIDNFIFYTFEGTNYLVSYIGNEIDIIIPKDYNGEEYIVNSYAFVNCKFSSVTFESEHPKQFKKYAFLGCNNLKAVYIKDVASWCETAFANTYSNPLNCTPNLYINGELVKELKIPEGVESIGKYVFMGCLNLISVEIPSSLKSIGASAFVSCENIIEVINKSELNITKGSTDNGWIAFYASDVHNGERQTENIDGYIFCKIDGVYNLIKYEGNDTELILPANCNGENYVIKDDAFKNLSSITSVVISDGVTIIGNNAFYSCSNLRSVTIGRGVVEIGTDAFLYNGRLVEVINKSTLNLTVGSEDNGYVAYYALEVHGGESKFVDKDEYTFYTCNGVNYLIKYFGNKSELTLPQNYNGQNYIIYKNSFNNNDSLTSVIISDGVTKIGDYAFAYCSNLKSIVIGDGVTKIGDCAFAFCTSLESLTISDCVTEIGNEAFSNCDNLKYVTIGTGVTKIGFCAFLSCSNLERVKFKNTSGWKCSFDNDFSDSPEIPTESLSDEENAAYLLRLWNVERLWLRK